MLGPDQLQNVVVVVVIFFPSYISLCLFHSKIQLCLSKNTNVSKTQKFLAKFTVIHKDISLVGWISPFFRSFSSLTFSVSSSLLFVKSTRAIFAYDVSNHNKRIFSSTKKIIQKYSTFISSRSKVHQNLSLLPLMLYC